MIIASLEVLRKTIYREYNRSAIIILILCRNEVVAMKLALLGIICIGRLGSFREE